MAVVLTQAQIGRAMADAWWRREVVGDMGGVSQNIVIYGGVRLVAVRHKRRRRWVVGVVGVVGGISGGSGVGRGQTGEQAVQVLQQMRRGSVRWWWRRRRGGGGGRRASVSVVVEARRMSGAGRGGR